MPHQDTGGDAARQKESITFREASRCYVKRKLGAPRNTSGVDPNAQAKRRRTKSYQMILYIENMLKGVGKSLAHFFVAFVNDSYVPSDPYEWGHLSISPDRGADMVYTGHFFWLRGWDLLWHRLRSQARRQ